MHTTRQEAPLTPMMGMIARRLRQANLARSAFLAADVLASAVESGQPASVLDVLVAEYRRTAAVLRVFESELATPQQVAKVEAQ
jgi:hypothetical protein